MKKRCRACETHDAEMIKVWTGLIQVYRRQLTDARRARKSFDERRLRRLIQTYEGKIATATATRCPYEEAARA